MCFVRDHIILYAELTYVDLLKIYPTSAAIPNRMESRQSTHKKKRCRWRRKRRKRPSARKRINWNAIEWIAIAIIFASFFSLHKPPFPPPLEIKIKIIWLLSPSECPSFRFNSSFESWISIILELVSAKLIGSSVLQIRYYHTTNFLPLVHRPWSMVHGSCGILNLYQFLKSRYFLYM